MNSKIIFAIGIVILGLIGCVVSMDMPTENDAILYHTNLDTLKAGRKLYVKKCSSCHNLYLPSKYNSLEWQKNLEKMQKRAKIDSTQKELINNYLITACKKSR
jgi:hypothetical protein